MKTKPLPFVLFLHGGIFLISAAILESISAQAGGGILVAILFVGFGGLAYLLPSYIAAIRATPRFVAIFGLNVLAGWSFIGWVAALIWAFVDINKENPQVVIQQVYTTHSQPPPVVYPPNQSNG